CPDRYRLRTYLAVTYYEHIRDFLQPRLADPVSKLLVPVIKLTSDSYIPQLLSNGTCVVNMSLANRHHDSLHRRQPYREGPCEVLDQHPHEPFKSPKDNSVNHNRPVFVSIVTNIGQVKPL